MDPIDERLTELETRMAFLEHANQQLGDLVYRQQQQIDRHIRETTKMLENIQTSQAPGDPADEIPPHY